MPTKFETESPAHPDSVYGRLADFLTSRKEQVMHEWLTRIRQCPDLPTDALNHLQLVDHLPRIFDDLGHTLRRYESERVADECERDAKKHGTIRWQQGYSPWQLLLEVKCLRLILVHHLCVFDDMNPDFGGAARMTAISAVHGFLDGVCIDAIKCVLSDA